MKIGLGCVQFGLKYGVTNSIGKVSSAEVRNILNHAYLAGIDTLDTATLYGDSEVILGKNDSGKNFKIITKLPDISSVRELEHAVSTSLSRLRVNHLDGLLFHRTEILFKSRGKKIIDRINQYKIEGLIGLWGVSVYHPQELMSILDYYSIDLVQLPLNILDQRFLSPEITSALKKNQVCVHARSLLLQGLLCHHIWPKPFYQWRHIQKQLYNISQHYHVSPMTLAMSICHHAKNVDRFMLGFQSVEQLKQGLTAYKQSKVLNIQFSNLAQSDEKLINPAFW